MQGYDPSRLLEISREFHIHGELLDAEPCKVGHINETYTATYNQGGVTVRYIHQRINHEVFKDPARAISHAEPSRSCRRATAKVITAPKKANTGGRLFSLNECEPTRPCKPRSR